MVGKRRITKPTLGVVLSTSDAVSVPPGDIIEIPIAPADGARTIDVMWHGQKLMMFVNDLKDRSQRINS